MTTSGEADMLAAMDRRAARTVLARRALSGISILARLVRLALYRKKPATPAMSTTAATTTPLMSGVLELSAAEALEAAAAAFASVAPMPLEPPGVPPCAAVWPLPPMIAPGTPAAPEVGGVAVGDLEPVLEGLLVGDSEALELAVFVLEVEGIPDVDPVGEATGEKDAEREEEGDSTAVGEVDNEGDNDGDDADVTVAEEDGNDEAAAVADGDDCRDARTLR